MTRKEFLTEFLSTLGSLEIRWYEENDNYISGTLIYDLEDPDETQEFCWHKSEHELPSEKVYNLTMLLNKNSLLDIDKIKISRDDLYSLYKKEFDISLSKDQFNSILDELKAIEVSMVDNGIETDMFIIHE